MRTFEVALAEMIAFPRRQLEDVVDKNPDLPVEVRAALVRIVGKLYPISDYEYLLLMRESYPATPLDGLLETRPRQP